MSQLIYQKFRPPYGSYNDLVLQVLAERGYKKVFLWSDDTEDASGSSIGFQQGVLDGVINSYPQPHMVLQHSVLDTSEYCFLPFSHCIHPPTTSSS
jgi:peptidoglycan/xylan/chitin deacetylase (PgdA/CDA1 family)